MDPRPPALLASDSGGPVRAEPGREAVTMLNRRYLAPDPEKGAGKSNSHVVLIVLVSVVLILVCLGVFAAAH
ncbi:hypothetical protein L3i22_058880 [Actinoplanes sp. L3-i22]|nr:hypothetical protein L3i22_058880 [Actinoplanes sp. L3-i22]